MSPTLKLVSSLQKSLSLNKRETVTLAEETLRLKQMQLGADLTLVKTTTKDILGIPGIQVYVWLQTT